MGPSQMTSVQSGSLPSLDLLVVFFYFECANIEYVSFSFFRTRYFLLFLGSITEIDSPIATGVTVAWSVRLYVYVRRLSHPGTLLKPLYRMRCHLAGTLMWSEVTLY